MTRSGLAAGYAQPCAPLKGFEKSITTHIDNAPEKSVFWAPFAKPRPAAITPPTGARCRRGRRR